MRPDLIFHDMEQGTPEWYAARMGRVTGSAASVLLTNGKSADGLGAGAWTLIYKLAGEIITGQPAEPQIDNYWTERGKQLEAEAITAYMDHTFHQVNRVGFIEWGRFAGCSPDGMVDDALGCEVKCLSAKEHLRYAHTRQVEKDYMAQVQWCLFVTGFERWHYIHYHPNMGRLSLIIDEMLPDPKTHDLFAQRLELIGQRIEEIVALAAVAESNSL